MLLSIIDKQLHFAIFINKFANFTILKNNPPINFLFVLVKDHMGTILIVLSIIREIIYSYLKIKGLFFIFKLM